MMTHSQLTLFFALIAATGFASGYLLARARYGECQCHAWDMADLHVIEPDELREVETTGQFEDTTVNN